MRYKIFIVMAIFGITQSAFAQFQEDAGKTKSLTTSKIHEGAFEYGLQHSFNFTTLVGDYPNEDRAIYSEVMKPVGTRFTFDVGAFGNYYATEKISIQFELNFSFMGAHSQTTRTTYQDLGKFEDTKSESFAFHYIKIPLTLNFNLTDNLYIQGGGYFASLLNAKKFDYYSGPFNRTRVEDISQVDFGVIGGIGFNTSIVRISMRYNYGLVNVMKNNPDYPNANLKNSVFQIVGHWLIYSDVRKRKKYENN